jgi:hypothetical protein
VYSPAGRSSDSTVTFRISKPGSCICVRCTPRGEFAPSVAPTVIDKGHEDRPDDRDDRHQIVEEAAAGRDRAGGSHKDEQRHGLTRRPLSLYIKARAIAATSAWTPIARIGRRGNT